MQAAADGTARSTRCHHHEAPSSPHWYMLVALGIFFQWMERHPTSKLSRSNLIQSRVCLTAQSHLFSPRPPRTRRKRSCCWQHHHPGYCHSHYYYYQDLVSVVFFDDIALSSDVLMSCRYYSLRDQVDLWLLVPKRTRCHPLSKYPCTCCSTGQSRTGISLTQFFWATMLLRSRCAPSDNRHHSPMRREISSLQQCTPCATRRKKQSGLGDLPSDSAEHADRQPPAPCAEQLDVVTWPTRSLLVAVDPTVPLSTLVRLDSMRTSFFPVCPRLRPSPSDPHQAFRPWSNPKRTNHPCH